MLKSFYSSFFKRRSWLYNKLHHADLTNIGLHVKSTCLHSDSSSGSFHCFTEPTAATVRVHTCSYGNNNCSYVDAHLLSLSFFAVCWSNRSVYTRANMYWHYPIWHNTGPSLMMVMYICHILEEWISQIPRKPGCGECQSIQISVISSTPADTLWGRW